MPDDAEVGLHHPDPRHVRRREDERLDLHGELASNDRLSDTALGFSIKLDDRTSLGFLPGQYVNIQVPGHRPGPVVLVQLRAGRRRGRVPDPEHHLRRPHHIPAGEGQRRRQDLVQRSAGQLLPAQDREAGAVPGRGHRPRALPLDAAQDRAGRRQRAPDPPDLRRDQRRRPGQGRRARGLRLADAQLHLHLRGGGGGEQLSEQGFRHPPHEARAPQRRLRRRLPLRSAADGRRGPQVPGRPGHRAGELLLREVLRHPAWSARSASRTSRPSTPTRRSTRGWRWSWGPPSWWWASSRASSSPSTAGWPRPPAQYIKDGHFTDPAGLPGGQLGLPPVPDRGHGQRCTDRGLPQAARAGVHGAGAHPVGRRGRRHHPGPHRDRRRLRERRLRGPAADHRPNTPTTRRRRCGPASRSPGG